MIFETGQIKTTDNPNTTIKILQKIYLNYDSEVKAGNAKNSLLP